MADRRFEFSPETHAHFIETLRESEPARADTAMWLIERGFIIDMDPLSVAPAHQVRQQYSDGGDIRLYWDLWWWIIEVKHRTKEEWTCAADFPYPTIFTVFKHQHDYRNPPRAYIIRDKYLETITIVPGSAFVHFRERPGVVNRDGMELVALEVPKEMAIYLPRHEDGEDDTSQSD